MLTQSEYEALLDRYLAGTSLPDEQRVVEQWYAQVGQDEPPHLSAAEQDEIHAAIWTRIEQLTHPTETCCSALNSERWQHEHLSDQLPKRANDRT